MNEKLRQAADFLLSRDCFEILTHDYPDGDTLGSGFGLCLALQQLGKRARVVTTDVPKDFTFLQEGIVPQEFEAETIVSVDVADEKLLGCNREKYEGKIDLCIDHHLTNKITAPLKCVDGSAAANCEILFALFGIMNVKITREIANNLYTGVSPDTGCFRYTYTTSKTLRIAAEIMDIGCDTEYINKVMFETKSRKKIALERAVYDTIEFCFNDRCAIIAATLEIQREVGVRDNELEGLASLPRQIEGVEIGVTMREKEPNVFKVSVRTNGVVNAADMCARLGGGGHAAAAGCSVKGSFEEAKNKLKAVIKEALCTE